jgi:ABC-type multidrug transport system fused ATPase/permease subunit
VTTPVATLCLFTISYYYRPTAAGGLDSGAVFYALSLLSLPEFYLLRLFVRSWQRLQEFRSARARLDEVFAYPEPAPAPADRWLQSRGGGGGGGGGGSGESRGVKEQHNGGGGGGGGGGGARECGAVEVRGGCYAWPRGTNVDADADADAAGTATAEGGGVGDGVEGTGLGGSSDDDDSFVVVNLGRAECDGSPEILLHKERCLRFWRCPKGAPPTLVDISLRLRPGELLGVTGATGSGKTSLLACLLGELREVEAPPECPGLDGSGGSGRDGRDEPAFSPRQLLLRRQGSSGGGAGGGGGSAATGSVLVAGRTSYVPQQPWVAFGTLRDNITLAAPTGGSGGGAGSSNVVDSSHGSGVPPLSPGDTAFYNQVIEACALTNDLLTLTAGERRRGAAEGGAKGSGWRKGDPQEVVQGGRERPPAPKAAARGHPPPKQPPAALW